jgi:hypothetical protein
MFLFVYAVDRKIDTNGLQLKEVGAFYLVAFAE